MRNLGPLFQDNWSAETIKKAMALEGPILVVGASGFVGARLFHSLIQRRGDVYAASQNIFNSWRMLQLPKEIVRGNLISLDITSLRDLKKVITAIKPKTVFNLSAYGAYERQQDVEKIHRVNYLGTLNLLQTLAETGVSAFVHTGSSSEYGTNCNGPDELAELIPNSHYAASKASAGYLIKYYGKFLSLPAVNLRLYSVYGPWEERDRLIPRLVTCGLKKEFPPLVGEHISRDFLYVDDCTDAMISAALKLCKEEPGISLNVCTGKKTTLGDLATYAKAIFGIERSPEFGSMPNRRWDLSDWFGKPDRANSLLEWRAATDVTTGLKHTAEWERQGQGIINIGVVPKSSKKISAIIACYRDHEAIPIMHERLVKTITQKGYDYEIIFVNDNSPTRDEEVIRDICARDPNVLGISHSRNFGSQSAFLSGMEIATGDAVALLDGDLQDPPEVIAEFIDKWEQGNDVVYGVRVKREAKFHMQILYKIFYRIFKYMAEVQIPVDAGDFSLIDKRVVRQLVQFRERDVFLRGLRAWVGFKQVGVPYVRPERMFGTSTNNFLKNIWWAKKAIFSFSLKPLEYIQRFGVAIFVLTILLSLFYLVNYFVHPPTAGRGTTTVVLLVLGLSGVQLLSISILGDYLGKILEEVKNRPKFIRSKIIRMGEILSRDHEIESFVQEVSGQNG